MSANFTHSSPSNTIPFHYTPTIRIPKPFLSFKQPPKAHFTPLSTPPNTTTNGNSDNNKVEYTDQDSSFSSKTSSNSTPAIKAPTAPWMSGPLLVEPNQMMDLSNPKNRKGSNFSKKYRPDKVLVDKVSGGRAKKAMKKIFQGIEKLKETKNSEDVEKNPENVRFRFSPGELWGEENCKLEEENEFERNGKKDTRNKVDGCSLRSEKDGLDISLEGIKKHGDLKSRKKMPWEKHEKMMFRGLRKEEVMSAAELNLDRVLLERLRGEALKMRRWVKVKKAGVTQSVVDQVHSFWKNNELAMLKFDLPLSRNMDRAREIVEMKTGGYVVWYKKDTLVVYRGCNYQFSLKTFSNIHHEFLDGQECSLLNFSCQDAVIVNDVNSNKSWQDEMMSRKDSEDKSISISGSLYERELDRLLDGLGPRFVDWWWRKPLPIDADELPEQVPGFCPPFRLCPPGVKPKLTNDELTHLRMLARPLQTHFVLGRNQKLQGLAVAILKLWEKCHIAKIAVKWGIPNTDNEQMANELKFLTGGVLLLRNKFFIILYRGKDFLPPLVANLVVRRELELTRCQLQEEAARLKATEDFSLTDEQPLNSPIGTLSEFRSIQSEFACTEIGNSEAELELKAEKEMLEKELRSEQCKLHILKKKIENSAKELACLNFAWQPFGQGVDEEIITEEERECLRKIGLKMEPSLVLGRRGVYDGVIEGLHQHWKHREVVKVITMQRRVSQIIHTANLLKAESGGILVAVDKLKEGHAIIIYRGKNYTRPKLVLDNLLNKRDALLRSLVMQRIGSLKYFAHQREQAISNLKCKLAELEEEIQLIVQT